MYNNNNMWLFEINFSGEMRKREFGMVTCSQKKEKKMVQVFLQPIRHKSLFQTKLWVGYVP